jgi:hypothetical protein
VGLWRPSGLGVVGFEDLIGGLMRGDRRGESLDNYISSLFVLEMGRYWKKSMV